MTDPTSKPDRRSGLPLSRRVVCSFLSAGRHAEPVTFERVMALEPLRHARDAHPQRVMWTAIFLKGIGLAADVYPELGEVVLNRPWTRIDRRPVPVAALTLSREHGGEEFVLLLPIKDPARESVLGLNAKILRAKEAPVESVSAFRNALRLARLPLPLRWLATSLTCRVGRWRAKAFGTFGLSVTPQWGATALNLRSPWGCAFHYDCFEPDGKLRVRLTFDHRLLDGHRACQILEELERVLTGPVREELIETAAATTDTIVAPAA